MRVKICGLTNYEDAVAAVQAGADMLGFNFYPPSPRCIRTGDCRTWVARLRAAFSQPVTMVGVFVNASAAEMQSVMDTCGLDLAQLSGDESPETLRALGERAFKALRPASPQDLNAAVSRYPLRSTLPAWLIDAFRPGEFGGTGQIADWSLARALARLSPVMLAGGLRPDNVAQAVEQVRPWGVDVASGVESAPGRKDHGKMAAFVQAARSNHLIF